jgi:DNA-binding response OmpR family regulator/nitrogen-specific signal transduction histidine kinase
MGSIENRRQKELSRAKLRFFTDVSHEIRTPLTLILTPLEALISDYRSDVRLYKQLIGIKDNADRLLRLVNQLLDFRKKDSKNIRLRVAEGNIVKFIDEIHLAFQEQAKRKKVTLHFNTDFQELKVYFDRDELEKVFFNLINNAIKYSSERGKIDIEIKHSKHHMSSESEDMVSIAIRDNGTGINAEDMEKIFERYYNSSHSGISKLSTGIGLSLSKKIVDAHNGKITCTSKLSDHSDDNCTTFTVYLLLGSDHFSSSEIIEGFKDSENIDTYHYLLKQFDDMVIPFHGEDRPPLEAHKYTILIAEDNYDIRSFVAGHLGEDYNIVEAENGENALSSAYETIPDLIITDVIMPKMDGLKLCSMIKNDERTSHIPVIILTARTALIHKADGLENGADEYITKPFNMRLMKVKIRNLIRSRETMREKFSQEFILKPENIVLSTPDVKFLTRVKEVIEEHISDPDFNVDSFSIQIGMSRPVLYRKIRAVTNMTVVELINTYRLERAAEVLKSNLYSIAEIATQVGFSDPKYFSKTFRKKYGVSPSQYLNHEIE